MRLSRSTLAAALLLALSTLTAACGGGPHGTSATACGACADMLQFVNGDRCSCCKAPGASCTSSAECCGGCVNGVCGCLPGPSDMGTATICGNPAACCSGSCTPSGTCK